MTPVSPSYSKSPGGLAFHRTGRGAPVVLIHGVGLRSESWQLQIEDLQSDYEVYAIDLPGHGHSDPLTTATSCLRDYTRTLADFIETTIRERVVVIGHSMGAMIALDLAGRHSGHCAGVAALNAIYRRDSRAREAVRDRARSLSAGPGRADDRRDTATAPVKRWFGDRPDGDNAWPAAQCRLWLTQVDLDGYSAAYTVFASEDGPSDDALAALSVPTLFLTGDKDFNSTPEMTNMMAKKARQASAVTVAGAGHMAMMTHGQQVNTALRNLLSQVPNLANLWSTESEKA